MKRIRHVRLDELDPRGGPVFAGLQPETPWEALDYWALTPGEERSVPGTGMACEQGYVFTGGPVALTVRQQRIESGEGPGFIVESTGSAHELKNLTAIPVQVLRVRVAMDVDAETQQRHVNLFWGKVSGRQNGRYARRTPSQGDLRRTRAKVARRNSRRLRADRHPARDSAQEFL